jgi:hypothetical protein
LRLELKQFQPENHGRKDVVEIMGYATRELPDHLHFLGLPH